MRSEFRKISHRFLFILFRMSKIFVSLQLFMRKKKTVFVESEKSKNHLTVEKIFRKKHIIVSRREIDGARWPDWKSIYHPIIDLLLSRNFKQTRNESQLLTAAAEKVWVNRKSNIHQVFQNKDLFWSSSCCTSQVVEHQAADLWDLGSNLLLRLSFRKFELLCGY